MKHKTLETRGAPTCEHRSVPLTIRSVGDTGVVEGYGSVFGVKDSYDDIIAAGAFKASIAAHKEEGTMPAMLWQHNADEPVGIWTDMSEDEKGLKITGQLVLDTTRGREALALLKAKALNGLSIGFMTKKYERDNDTDIRTLTEIDLWEVSLVTFPANGKARVTGVKGETPNKPITFATPKDAERALRDAGLSKAESLAFMSEIMRLGGERRDAAIAQARLCAAGEALARAFNPQA